MWMEILKLAVSPIIAFLGVIVTVIVMNKQNRRQQELSNRHFQEQLKATNERFEKQLSLEIEKVRIETVNRRQDRELQIGQALLDKTLSALQEAYVHIMAVNHLLNQAANIARSSETLNVQDEADRLHKRLEELRKWWDQNCLYLPNDIRKGLLGLINKSHLHLMELFEGLVSGSNREIWDTYFELSDDLERKVSEFRDRFDIIGQSESKGNA